MKKILFITPYPRGAAGSQRFRFEQFLEEIAANGYKIKQVPFVDMVTYKVMYQPGNLVLKILGLLKGLFNRIGTLIIAPFYDIIYIHREASPFGPPVIEWILSKIYNKKFIYDFDDAIWNHDISESNKGLVQKIKSSPNKISKIISYAGTISAGNMHLANYAKKFNPNIKIIPTIVDTNYHKRTKSRKDNEKICIGWTGTHTTLRHFEHIVPILEKLYTKYKDQIYFKLIVNLDVEYKQLNLKSTRWKFENEIEELQEFDIGLMPLPNNKWSKGKCGFKAIQYMALSIPCVASNVGVNSKIIDHNYNGYLLDNFSDFYDAIDSLINDPKKRDEMGTHAREKIVNNYSKSAILNDFLESIDII